MKKTITIIAIFALAGVGLWLSRPAPERGGPPPGFDRAVLVKAETVATGTLANTVEALGTATAKESLTITASLTDTVSRVNFDDGDYVEAGEVLVELTDDEESAQLAEARANLGEAQRRLQRLEELDKQGIAIPSDVDEARSQVQAAQARLDAIVARLRDRLIRAPFEGLLGFRQISPGTLIMPGDAITTLDDISQIKLDFTVPETYLSLITPGSRVFARSSAWRDTRFEGVVASVGSRVDPATRSVTVRAIIDNHERLLRPGMLLSVEVLAEQKSALTVPERAVLQIGDQAFVFTIDDEQRATRREVSLGLRQGGLVEITDGLEDGERVVTDGVVKLRDGIAVRVAESEPSKTARARPGRPDTAQE